MTIQEIQAFLSNEEAMKSNDSKLTRFVFVSGDAEVMHFYRKNQREELYKENIWLASTLDAPDNLLQFRGEHIEKMLAGSKFLI